MLVVVAGALGLLLVLSLLVEIELDRGARDTAWRRIAAERRANDERARELDELCIAIDAHRDDLDVRTRRLEQREQSLFRREAELRLGQEGRA